MDLAPPFGIWPPLVNELQISRKKFYDVIRSAAGEKFGILKRKSPLLCVKIRQSHGPLDLPPLVKF